LKKVKKYKEHEKFKNGPKVKKIVIVEPDRRGTAAG